MSGEPPVTLPLMDRLLDDDPKTSSEAPATRFQSVRQLKASVRRDLEWLLNSRRIAVPPDESLKEVCRSVYNFGLPDFSTLSMANPSDRSRLVRSLSASVRMFEPRLANVQVIPMESAELGSRTLRFRIDGMLLMDPAPEHISFDTVLELTSGEYTVRGGPDA